MERQPGPATVEFIARVLNIVSYKPAGLDLFRSDSEACHALWTIVAGQYHDTGAEAPEVLLRVGQDPTYMDRALARYCSAAPESFEATTAARVAADSVLNQGLAKLGDELGRSASRGDRIRVPCPAQRRY